VIRLTPRGDERLGDVDNVPGARCQTWRSGQCHLRSA